MTKKPEQPENPQVRPAYTRPQLVVLGAVSTLTATGGLSQNENRAHPVGRP